MESVEHPLLERATLTIPEVARILGLNRTRAYVLAQRDELPVRVIRLGKQIRVSRIALERLLESNVAESPSERPSLSVTPDRARRESHNT